MFFSCGCSSSWCTGKGRVQHRGNWAGDTTRWRWGFWYLCSLQRFRSLSCSFTRIIKHTHWQFWLLKKKQCVKYEYANVLQYTLLTDKSVCVVFDIIRFIHVKIMVPLASVMRSDTKPLQTKLPGRISTPARPCFGSRLKKHFCSEDQCSCQTRIHWWVLLTYCQVKSRA